MNIAYLLLRAAAIGAGEPAIVRNGEVLVDYSGLAERVARYAAGFKARGLSQGARILLAAPNTPDYLLVMCAAWHAGLCVAPVNARLHPREIAAIADDCDAGLIIAAPDLAGALGQHRPTFAIDSEPLRAIGSSAPVAVTEVASDAPAWLFYTSGTTGRSKGAVLTHRNLMAMTLSFLADSGAAMSDAILHMLPMSHASGLMALAYVSRALPHILLGPDGVTHQNIRTALSGVRRVSFFAVPTIVNRLMNEDLIGPHLVEQVHRIFFGGAPMYVSDLKRALAWFGPERLWHLYGQGEAPNTIAHLPPALWGTPGSEGYEKRLGAVGIARSGVALRISNDDGQVLPAGQTGEVEVRGDVVMAGYWNNPTATATVLREGWLRTGDIGRIDANGFLTLSDRSKDVIISGGSNIYPREIEEILLTSAAVAECAVIGVPHAKWGEVPVAFIVRAGAVERAELDTLCLSALARFKRPHAYHFVESLPKSAYGKTLKIALRAMLAQHPST